MISKSGVGIGLFLIVILACAQGGESLKKIHKPAVKTTNSPVTVAEASVTLKKMVALINKELHLSLVAKSLSGSSLSPVQRADVVESLGAIYRGIEPKFTNSPRKTQVEMARLVVDRPSDKKNAVLLVEKGFIAPLGALVTGKKKTVTVPEFGDAIGYFLARTAECSYMPSVKWTPILHD